MKQHQNDTAILIFTRSLETEKKHKKLSVHHNGKILQKLINQSENIAKRSGLPYFISSDRLQFGKSFGERLFNEMWRVFNEGYEKIIVIGNDSPELRSETIISASEDIKVNNIVLGPSKDGGVYLIGIHKKNLQKHLFLNLPWLSDRVYPAFLEYASALALKVETLTKFRDLDSEKDLLDFIKIKPLEKFSLWLNTVLSSNHPAGIEGNSNLHSFDILGYKQLRAPPTPAN